jgi:hypothetical protein
MKIDWLLIGAMSGLTGSAALLGIGAVAVLRSGPEEALKSPPPPVLWSSRRTDAAAPPDLHIFSSSPGPAVAGSAALAPARKRPASNYELFPTTANADASPTAVTPPSPRVAPIVAKPTPAPEPRKPTTAYPLARVNPAPARPQVQPGLGGEQPKIIDRRYEGVFTMAEIAKLKSTLRITPDQEPLWRPVEAELRKVGRLQMSLVDSGRKPDIPPSAYQPLYQAAMPLLANMRPDQKERVRVLARERGYGAVASLI